MFTIDYSIATHLDMYRFNDHILLDTSASVLWTNDTDPSTASACSRRLLPQLYDCVSTMMEEGTQEDLVALKLKHTHHSGGI